MTLPANCPVCACELSVPVEICTACHTPHHADCAHFVGRCAVFGCGAFEFMAIDGAVAGFGMPSGPIHIEPVPDDPASKSGAVAVPRSGAVATPTTGGAIAAPRGSLNRGIPARMLAAGQLLAANPTISLPVGAILLLFSLLPVLIPGGAGLLVTLMHTVGWLLGQALMVIMLVSRAQGKEASFEQALTVANERGKRIVLTGLASCLIVGTSMAAGLVMTLAGLVTKAIWLAACGSVLTLFGFKKYVSWSLVTIVAAMGHDEEPTNALSRSTELVGVARAQAAFSVIAFLGGAVLLTAILPGWLSFGVTTAVGLLSTAYWTLFYLEARRLHQRSFLPYAPLGYLPPAATKARAGNR